MAAPSSAAPSSAAQSAAPDSPVVDSGEALSHGWPTPPGAWTAPDLSWFPIDGQRYEIFDGCLHATPAPDGWHQRVIDAIVAALLGTAPPSWRPVSPIRVRVDHSFLVPDVAVLRPGSAPDTEAVRPSDVALVVEVESPYSKRVDRCLKPALYAEAGIESYWRVEDASGTTIVHLYTRAAAGHYQLHRSVHAGQCVTAELPYAVQLAPAAWH